MSNIFDTASLNTAVKAALKEADVPDDHKNAFAVVATTNGLKGVLSTRINDIWHVDTVIMIDRQRHVDGGVSVKATWG